MTLRSPVVAPPTVLLLAEMPIAIPPPALGSGDDPSAFVPTKFPATTLPVAAAPVIWPPAAPLPEITLRSAGAGPPTVLLEPPMLTPCSALPRFRAPVTSRSEERRVGQE